VVKVAFDEEQEDLVMLLFGFFALLDQLPPFSFYSGLKGRL